MFRPEALWIAALLTTGVAGALVYNWPAGSPPTSDPLRVDGVENVAEEPLDARGLSLIADKLNESRSDSTLNLDSMQTGDRYLIGGNYIGAYEQYSQLAGDQTRVGGALLIRLGLSAEHAGFFEQSVGHYLDAIQSPSSTAMHKLRGLMGMARVWEKQERYDDAINLLSELFLIYAFADLPGEIRIGISQRLADCLQKRKLLDRGPHAEPQVEYEWSLIAIEPLLIEDVEVNESAFVSEGSSSMKVIQNPVGDLTLVLIDAKLFAYSHQRLLSELTESIGIELEVSSKARSRLAGRSVRINANAIPAAAVLDQLLGPLDLVWRQHDQRVKVMTRDELDEAGQGVFEFERIQHVQQQMQFVLVTNRERATLLLNSGNNDFLQGDSVSALDKYDAARQLTPSGELSAKLYFNQATTLLEKGELTAALDRFYQTLDQTLSPRMQAIAYGMIADLELQLGQTDSAIIAASRGLRIGNDPDLTRNSFLTLVKAYLLQSDALSANRVLHTHKGLITDESTRRLASVLSAYARFQVTKPTRGLQNEGSDWYSL